MRSELSPLKLGALVKRARAAGIVRMPSKLHLACRLLVINVCAGRPQEQAALYAAQDSDDPKAAIVELILQVRY